MKPGSQNAESFECTIRPAVLSDVPALYDMLRKSAEEQGGLSELCVDEDILREDGFGPQPRFSALIAEMGVQTAGMALYFFTYSTWTSRDGLYLEDLYVMPQFRKSGVALALMARLKEIAAERGCKRFHWFVLRNNESAIRFYKRLGAEEMRDWMPMKLADVGRGER